MLETGCFESHLVAEIVKEIIIGTTHLNIYGLVSPSTHILAVSAYNVYYTKKESFYEIPCVRK